MVVSGIEERVFNDLEKRLEETIRNDFARFFGVIAEHVVHVALNEPLKDHRTARSSTECFTELLKRQARRWITIQFRISPHSLGDSFVSFVQDSWK